MLCKYKPQNKGIINRKTQDYKYNNIDFGIQHRFRKTKRDDAGIVPYNVTCTFRKNRN